jgi:hypothetical protein
MSPAPAQPSPAQPVRRAPPSAKQARCALHMRPPVSSCRCRRPVDPSISACSRAPLNSSPSFSLLPPPSTSPPTLAHPTQPRPSLSLPDAMRPPPPLPMRLEWSGCLIFCAGEAASYSLKLTCGVLPLRREPALAQRPSAWRRASTPSAAESVLHTGPRANSLDVEALVIPGVYHHQIHAPPPPHPTSS